jgi:hypothetical protein
LRALDFFPLFFEPFADFALALPPLAFAVFFADPRGGFAFFDFGAFAAFAAGLAARFAGAAFFAGFGAGFGAGFRAAAFRGALGFAAAAAGASAAPAPPSFMALLPESPPGVPGPPPTVPASMLSVRSSDIAFSFAPLVSRTQRASGFDDRPGRKLDRAPGIVVSLPKRARILTETQ